ncbi:hypothetical protein [Streptomyces atratus]|uniref:hypothetical protein n=1 Tax=Streptomyces atratus TaxID=1893 RepID=UPI0033FAE76B
MNGPWAALPAAAARGAGSLRYAGEPLVTDAEWTRIRRGLTFGRTFPVTDLGVPRPGAIGFSVDIGLPVGGCELLPVCCTEVGCGERE